MLPSFAKLRLGHARRAAPTGEFFPLDATQVEQLNAGGEKEAFTTDEFQEDSEPWHTFRVRGENPRANGTYDYKYYRAESLWEHVKRGNRFDPITRGPIWYEDYIALHNKFAPGQPIPAWANDLRRINPIAAPPAYPSEVTLVLQHYWRQIVPLAAEAMARRGASTVYVDEVRNSLLPVVGITLTEGQLNVIHETVRGLTKAINVAMAQDQDEITETTVGWAAREWWREIQGGAKALMKAYGAAYTARIATAYNPAEYAREFVDLIVGVMTYFSLEATRKYITKGAWLTSFLSLLKKAWNDGVNQGEGPDMFSSYFRKMPNYLGGAEATAAYTRFQKALRGWSSEIIHHPFGRRDHADVSSLLDDTITDDRTVTDTEILGRTPLLERFYNPGAPYPTSPNIVAEKLKKSLRWMKNFVHDATREGIDAGARQAIEHFIQERRFYLEMWQRNYARENEPGVTQVEREVLIKLAMGVFMLQGSERDSAHWQEFLGLLVRYIAQEFTIDQEESAVHVRDASRPFVDELRAWIQPLREGGADPLTNAVYSDALAVLTALDGPSAPAPILPQRQNAQTSDEEPPDRTGSGSSSAMPQFRPISG
jgi:hypothetical protein